MQMNIREVYFALILLQVHTQAIKNSHPSKHVGPFKPPQLPLESQTPFNLWVRSGFWAEVGWGGVRWAL